MSARLRQYSLGVAICVLTAPVVEAHRIDELLQTSRITLERGRVVVDLELSPGIEVAPSLLKMIGLSDRDTVSAVGGQAFAMQLVARMQLSLDGRSLTTNLSRVEYPLVPVLRRGEGAIHIQATAGPYTAAPGSHVLVYRNEFDPGRSLYMAVAMLPTDSAVTIRSQEHGPAQRELTIHYEVSKQTWPAARAVIGVTALVVLGFVIARVRT